jgi:hypothetical protein
VGPEGVHRAATAARSAVLGCATIARMNHEPAQAGTSLDWPKILGWVALAFVVTEVVSAFFIEFPVAAIVFAALFLVGWFLLRRDGLSGVILVGVLLVIELAAIPFYEREDTDDWIVQGVALVLSLVGIVAAVGALWRRPRAPST